MKTLKNIGKNENAILGNISIDSIKKSVNILRETETNQASVLTDWNSNLVKGEKWYSLTNGRLPIEFQKATKEVLMVEWVNMPINSNALGKYIVDGKVKRVDDNTFAKHNGEKLDITMNLVLNGDLKNIKEVYGKALADTVKDIRRLFTKDFWDKKINQWKAIAKTLDETDGDADALKKEKANRTFLEMLQWNILGEPDQYSKEGYSNSLLRKAINSKDGKANAKTFEKLAKKFLADYENAVSINSANASEPIKALTK